MHLGYVDNLIANGDFSQNFTSWNITPPSNGSLEFQTTTGSNHSSFLDLFFGHTDFEEFAAEQELQIPADRVGKNHSLSFDVRIVKGESQRIDLLWSVGASGFQDSFSFIVENENATRWRTFEKAVVLSPRKGIFGFAFQVLTRGDTEVAVTNFRLEASD